MRLKFAKGKQRELIESFKSKNKLTWGELCKTLNAEYGKLRAYFYETSLIDDKLYFILDKQGDYSKFILEKLEEGWGKKKGGKLSSGNTKMIKSPNDSIELAEFYGVMLGDGNSHRTKSYKRGTYMIRIVGDARLDRDYLLGYVKPIIENLFDISVRVGHFKGSNAIFIESHSRELVNFLEKKGFKPGNKIKNNLEVPNWIKENPSFLKVCLRGLYDTDGSVYKITNQNSYQFCFTNCNQFLLRDVRDSLLKLGINCSKISKNEDIYITKKSELRKFLKVIGFSNNRHLNKIKMWNLNSPIV